jgi:multidrug efflux pump subunit AcrB
MSAARRRPIRFKTAAILSAYIDEIKPQLPPGVEIATYEVAADALSARIWLLVKNGLGGLLVVVAILFLFLNARIAFWVAAGIPVAMLATIGFMYASGQTINMISLFSLIMMLGIIVDDAIVVGEHTATRLRDGGRSAHGRRKRRADDAGSGLWLRCRPRWLPSPRS